MKKFIMNLLGIEATAKNIRGRKSSGKEDEPNYKNWKLDIPLSGSTNFNKAID